MRVSGSQWTHSEIRIISNSCGEKETLPGNVGKVGDRLPLSGVCVFGYCMIASRSVGDLRSSEAEPEGSHGGFAASGAGGRYPNELCGLTVL